MSVILFTVAEACVLSIFAMQLFRKREVLRSAGARFTR
jgi:hypothetical protein